jgi:outer membrane protein assembly factor BamB
MADRPAAGVATAKAPPVDPFQLLFVGTHGHVVAFQKFTGKEVWRTSLPKTGWSLVTLLVEDGVLFASSKGHLFALDPLTGEIFWSNPMSGLGSGHACLATMRQGSDRAGNPLPQVAASEADAARHAST